MTRVRLNCAGSLRRFSPFGHFRTFSDICTSSSLRPLRRFSQTGHFGTFGAVPRSLFGFQRAHASRRSSRPRHARRTKNARRINRAHCTTDDMFRGPIRPGFSGVFGCARPGLEIGEKKDFRGSAFRVDPRQRECRLTKWGLTPFCQLTPFCHSDPLLSLASLPQHEKIIN